MKAGALFSPISSEFVVRYIEIIHKLMHSNVVRSCMAVKLSISYHVRVI